MATPDMDVIKEIPGYKVILKAVLKSQIQQLVEQLASTTEEESVMLTASVADGTLCHLGSDSGKVFLEDHEDIKSQFLGFCLKRHHKKKQEKERREAQEREEALARSMQAVTPPRYDGMGGGFMAHRSPRYHSPQQGLHPVSLSRASPGARMRSPSNRHQPYPMTRPVRAPLNFEQQGRPPGQGPGPSPVGVPVRNNKLDGQVIKIEPEDEDDKTDQSASENTTVQTPTVQTPTDLNTNISESSQPSSPSVKPSTPSQTQGPSASDNEDAKSESSTSTIPNEASDLKLSDSAPTGGLSLDSDLSNIISASSDSNIQQPSTSQDSTSELGTTEGLDPNVSVKLEAGGYSEMDLEITGVELGQSTVQEPMSSQEWMANVQNVMQGATGSSADMAGQQGYSDDSNLNSHKGDVRNLHTNQGKMRNFLCEFCLQSFPDWDSLEQHRMVHSGEKFTNKTRSRNFKCDLCSKSFTDRWNLTQHLRIHTGERPYACTKCGRRFAKKCNMQTHMAIHFPVNI
ncbi:zinc finger and SCAN domain-containing protein 12-like isoform X2 [Mercenaria mercenaria]|uniref:zinc finger and SCAN domain-containing protein 12-like isoform X2 n=1 Tax=Mercenaria mercenaria TaxID=6596 RepID=UPI00234F1D61|nr:zinc finger and SCAN domain-containing protein 12-like isoform X2 [Mercenaria mercenaria]